MAWATPKTWATNDLITAAQLNQDLRDNPLFLYTPPACRVYNSANISHASSGTDQTLTFNSERFDTDTMHSTSVNTGRITFTTAGKYLVGGHIEWAGSSSGSYRYMTVRADGTTAVGIQAQAATPSAVNLQQSIAVLYSFSASSYVELRVNQNTGGALNVLASGNYSPEFWACWQSS